jgi:CheY-specific phosphatase CheX
MNQTSTEFNIRQFIEQHVREVFDTMLSLPADLSPDQSLPHYVEHVTGSVGFAGEKVTGAVYFHLSAVFASRIAKIMLGLVDQETIVESEVNDVIGELTNMIAGGLKSALCDAGSTCAVSTPAIIRGAAFEIECPPDVQREIIRFNCEDNRIAVEIHIKHN